MQVSRGFVMCIVGKSEPAIENSVQNWFINDLVGVLYESYVAYKTSFAATRRQPFPFVI